MLTSRQRWLSVTSLFLGAALAGCGGGSSIAPQKSASPSYGGEPAGYPQATATPAPAEAPAFEAEGSSGGFFGGGAQAAPPAPDADRAVAPPSAATSAARRPSKGVADEAKSRSEVAPDPVDRPGLGTEWGETRFSQISTVSFQRADPETPFATASLFYNDEEGARAMASASGFARTASGVFRVANGVVTVGLRDERGRFLSGYLANGKSFVVGEAGSRYTIVVRNQTPARFECVVSVDGLDVLDGKPAAFHKRGYLIDPNGELEIEGFRQSMESVAAFRFGSVRGSYANQKHGDTRNVGVVGLAMFHERGSSPFPWTQEEIDRRRDANPFPGQFATPPR
jgi:hypothetical protein